MFPRLVLAAAALLFAAFGIAFVVAPHQLAALVDIPLTTSTATVDFIATEGIKLPQPPLKEIDGIGTATILDELARTNRQLGSAPLASPKLLTTMSAESQTFYKNEQPNPWLSAYTERATTHARH